MHHDVYDTGVLGWGYIDNSGWFCYIIDIRHSVWNSQKEKRQIIKISTLSGRLITETWGTFAFLGDINMKTLTQCDSNYYYVSINGDPDRVMKWHLTDSELPKRVNKLIKYVENAYTDMIARIDTIGMSPGTYDYIEKKEREVLAEFDRTFGDIQYRR